MRPDPLFHFLAFIVIGSFLWLVSNAAECQSTYTLYASPLGKRLTVAGETYQAYTLSEVKQLLAVDARLKEADRKINLHLEEITELKLSVDNLRLASAHDLKELNLLKDDLTRKDKLLTKQVTENLKLQQQLEFRKRILRIAGPLIGGIVGGLVLGIFLK